MERTGLKLQPTSAARHEESVLMLMWYCPELTLKLEFTMEKRP